MKKYPVIHHTNDRFGDGMSVLFPHKAMPVVITQDVYGEVEPLCQILVYELGNDQEEAAIAIRFNDDGSIAEICMPEKYRALVVKAEEHTASPWMVRRDGC
jgi:hypothetical protein